jgi:arylsulfatase A-like enzyme
MVNAESGSYNGFMERRFVMPGRYLLVLRILIFGSIAFHVRCNKEPSAPSVSSKANVLLVTFDTTRADYLSCYGRAGNTTSTIDAIAREGMRWANCYTTAPITLPAHATIMTGLYPFQHKLRDNGAGVLDEKAVTLAELFQGAGYRTGAFVGAYVLHSRYGLKQGFEVYSDEFKGTGAHMDDGAEFAERRADAVTDAALAWLQQTDDRSFFLWVHYFDPHAPYEAPGRTTGGDLYADYAAEITYADRELGRVVRKVDEISKNSNRQSWQIITADHGEGLGEHGEETHGLFTYNTTVHVPFVVKGPGVREKGAVSPAAVSLIDLYPSIVRWLELELTYEVPGLVLPLEPAGLGTDDYNRTSASWAPCFETYVPFHKYGWSPLEGIVVGHDKFINAPVLELYNLSVDPGETKNLASERKEWVAEMSALLPLARERQTRQSSPDIPALSAGQKEVDAESLKKLQSLGYVSGSQVAPSGSFALPDPKAMTGIRRKLVEAERLFATGNQSGVTLLGEVLDADPNNFRALAVLADFVVRPRFRKDLVAAGQARLQKPLPPPFDVEVPAAVGVALCMGGQPNAGLEIIAKAERIDAESSAVRAARAACSEQLAVRPASIMEIEQLAARFLREKNYQEAKRVLMQGVAAAPGDMKLMNSLAMLLATCPDSTVRDGAESLRLAKLLDERTNHAQPAILSTLAAAQAETGDYAAAVGTITRALQLVQGEESPLKGVLTQQLESFKAGKPYRSRV